MGDPRWIEVDGRRWRATDPAIPEAFRTELVDELMAARRAVGAARRRGDEVAERRARDRVQAAKVALGERGEPWWEPPTDDGRRARLEAAVLALARHRGAEKTICPSDAARAVGGDGWREVVPIARDAARELARAGTVEVTQRGEALDPDVDWRGPVRIRIIDR
jgi:hypothetical protein